MVRKGGEAEGNFRRERRSYCSVKEKNWVMVRGKAKMSEEMREGQNAEEANDRLSSVSMANISERERERESETALNMLVLVHSLLHCTESGSTAVEL